MKKYFIAMSLLFSVANADYLNTISKNECIYNVQPYQFNEGLCYTKRSDGQDICSTTLRYEYLINGYNYTNGSCLLSKNLEVTGLDYNTYKSLQALNASLYGFTLTLLMGFLFILLGRR